MLLLVAFRSSLLLGSLGFLLMLVSAVLYVHQARQSDSARFGGSRARPGVRAWATSCPRCVVGCAPVSATATETRLSSPVRSYAAPEVSASKGRSWWVQAFVALLRRPGLWPTAVAESVALSRRGWWRHWPPAPLASGWLAFRMETAYGDSRRVPRPEDVVAWLDWCKVSRRRTQLR